MSLLQDDAKVVRLVGRCWANNVYVVGWDDFSMSREFLGVDSLGSGPGSNYISVDVSVA